MPQYIRLLLLVSCHVIISQATVELWKCGRSFLDLPTIYIKNQEFEDLCLPLSQDARNPRAASCGMDAARACVAIRYLKNYNVPLYAGVHFQNTDDVIFGLNRRRNYPGGRPIGKPIPNEDGRLLRETGDDNGESPVGAGKKPYGRRDTWMEGVWGQDMCDISKARRKECMLGQNPLPKDCQAESCCWDTVAKQCYKPLEEGNIPQCNRIEKDARQVCSGKGTSLERCEAFGCCFMDDSCFNPSGRCELGQDERQRCGVGHMDEVTCLSHGCCWSPEETCYLPLGKYGLVRMSQINPSYLTGPDNYDQRKHTKGQMVYYSLVKRIQADMAPKTRNLFNMFVQYAGANIANIPRETQIENIMYNCLNTKGIKQRYLQNDFYFVTGSKPIDIASKDNEDFNGMNVPQLQWTAMCCVMQFKDMSSSSEALEAKTLSFSRGYLSSNEKPLNAKPTSETSSFHVFPKEGDPALLDLDELKEIIQNYSEEKTDNPIEMTVENFFGAGSICDVRTKKTIEQEQQEAGYFDQFKRILVQQPGENTLDPGESLKRLQQFFKKG